MIGTLRGDRVYVRVPRSHPSYACVRSCEGRRWHGGDTWSLPRGRAAGLIPGLTLDPPSPQSSGVFVPPGVDSAWWNGFRQYQRDGVAFLRERPHALLWDAPGLGKTRQAIAWGAGTNVLVVCPLAVVEQWIDEIAAAVVSRTCRTVDRKGNLVTRWGDGTGPVWTVCTYERSSKSNLGGAYRLIVDESTFIKNWKTRRTKAVLRLGEAATGVLALTGHPMVNRPIDLWPLYLLLRQRTEKEFWAWTNYYCAAVRTPYGWDFSGAIHLGDLRDDLAGFGLRREAEDVLTELPPLTVQDLRIPEPDLRAAEAAWSEVLEHVRCGESLRYGAGFGSVQHFRMECAAAKLTFVPHWIEQHHNEGGGKVVIFSAFKSPLHELKKHIKGMVVIDGDASEQERLVLGNLFRDQPETRVLGLTYGVGAVGLNLQHANTMLRLDLPWTPLEMEQSERRLYRMGQQSPVLVINLLSGHPIEHQMQQTLTTKGDIWMALTDGAKQLFIREGEL